MNIIRQKNTENELHNIVRQFTSLIGLSKLAKLVNYRRHSEIRTKIYHKLVISLTDPEGCLQGKSK